MEGETKTDQYDLKYRIQNSDQSKKVWIRWKIPKYSTIINKQPDPELRTNKITDFEKDFDEESKFQLRLKFLGRKGEMIQIYYLAPRPAFLKIDLENYKTSTPYFTKDYHWVTANKWQFLLEEKIDVIKKDSEYLWIEYKFTINMRSDDDTEIHNKMHKIGLICDLENLFNNPMLSDVTIKSNDGKEFHTHKLILSIRSEVLKAHFEHNTLESINNIVESPFESEVLQPVLMYIYSDNVPSVSDMPEKLLKAADFYQLNGLKYVCEKALQKQLTIDNVMEMMLLAHTYMADNLKRFCLEFINDGNAKLLIETKGWQDAPLELIKTIAVHVIKNS